MAANCLRNYNGMHMVFVGEGRGGVNGDDTFFSLLEVRRRSRPARRK